MSQSAGTRPNGGERDRAYCPKHRRPHQALACRTPAEVYVIANGLGHSEPDRSDKRCHHSGWSKVSRRDRISG